MKFLQTPACQFFLPLIWPLTPKTIKAHRFITYTSFPTSTTNTLALIHQGQKLHFSGTNNTKIQLRNPYFRKSGFYWWRRLQISSINSRRAKSRHIWPKPTDGKTTIRRQPILDKEWNYQVKGIKLSVKRLKMYARLIKGLHVQDAMDWLSSIPIIRINPIYNVLSFATQNLTCQDAQIERLFIKTAVVNYNAPLKFMRAQKNKKYSIMKSWRNNLLITLRYVSLDELFHRFFILSKIPKSMAMDMRYSLIDKRVSPMTIFRWYPYINGHSRFWHRKALKILDKKSLLDYNKVKSKWEIEYYSNLSRKAKELVIARTTEK